MHEASRTYLRLWDGAASVLHDVPLRSGPLLRGPHYPVEFAQKLYTAEALHPLSSSHAQDLPEPFSLQWFLSIENQRHGRRGRWLPRLLEFTKHTGETLLGL